MIFDTEFVPFSRFGSYIAFSTLSKEKAKQLNLPAGLWLRCLHGDAAREIFHVEAIARGKPVPFQIVTAPSHLTLKTRAGDLRICIAEEQVVRFHGNGVGLRLTCRPGRFHFAVPGGEDHWCVNVSAAFRCYRLAPLAGLLAMDAPWTVARCKHVIADFTPGANGIMDGAIEQYVGDWKKREYRTSFESCVQAVAKEFESFAASHPKVPAAYRAAAHHAAYINWESVVHPHRLLTRYSMLMSKNWMTKIWSWDHCFNAMACSYGRPELAWDQLMAVFDHQAPSGRLPDFVNDIGKLMNFVKPPIHGWTVSKMMRNNRWFRDPARLKEIYGKLGKHTDWWFTHRDPNGDGLPVYHHGNDSGWDNGTVFDEGFPIAGADLAAFLIVQMDTLADIATRLGKITEARRWTTRADVTFRKMMAVMWTGEQFVSPRASDGAIAQKSDSVFGCLPILLGRRLPAKVRQQLAKHIRRHMTPWGPATENIHSPLYEPDGYWRGPIWAPPTLILVDGLARAGEKALAKEIARKFCALVSKNGFAENYDAVKGTPLRDRAYTWTASVFIILAAEYV